MNVEPDGRRPVCDVVKGTCPGREQGEVQGIRHHQRIWDRVTDVVFYDNRMGDDDDAEALDAIEGGSIAVHPGAEEGLLGGLGRAGWRGRMRKGGWF